MRGYSIYYMLKRFYMENLRYFIGYPNSRLGTDSEYARFCHFLDVMGAFRHSSGIIPHKDEKRPQNGPYFCSDCLSIFFFHLRNDIFSIHSPSRYQPPQINQHIKAPTILSMIYPNVMSYSSCIHLKNALIC